MTSAHFSDKELACPCCGANKCTGKLLDALEAFRAVVKQAVDVTSGYRCPAHNKAVGGEPHSQHLLGNAADVRVVGMPARELEIAAEKIQHIHGIGRADFQGFLHLDVREVWARWCYDRAGREIAYYA